MSRRAVWQKKGERRVGRHVSYPEFSEPRDLALPPVHLPFEPTIQLHRRDEQTSEERREKREENGVLNSEEGGEQKKELKEQKEGEKKVGKDQGTPEDYDQILVASVVEVCLGPSESTNWGDMMDEEDRKNEEIERKKREEKKKEDLKRREKDEKLLRTKGVRIVQIQSLPPLSLNQVSPNNLASQIPTLSIEESRIEDDLLASETEEMEIVAMTDRKSEATSSMKDTDTERSDIEDPAQGSKNAQKELDDYVKPKTVDPEVSTLISDLIRGGNRTLRVRPTPRHENEPRREQGLRGVLPIENDPSGPMEWDEGEWGAESTRPPFSWTAPPTRATRPSNDQERVSKRRKKMENPCRQLTTEDYFPLHLERERSCTPPGPPNRVSNVPAGATAERSECASLQRRDQERRDQGRREQERREQERREQERREQERREQERRERERLDQERREQERRETRDRSGREEGRREEGNRGGSSQQSKRRGALFGGLEPIPIDNRIDPPPFACFNCWQPGHVASNCPRPVVRNYCYNCGRSGVDLTVCQRCSKAYLASRQGGQSQQRNAVERRDLGRRREEQRNREEETRREVLRLQEIRIREGMMNREEARRREEEERLRREALQSMEGRRRVRFQEPESSEHQEEAVEETDRIRDARQILADLRSVNAETREMVLKKIFGDPEPKRR